MIHQEGFIANETWVAEETELKVNANKRYPRNFGRGESNRRKRQRFKDD
ncbi:hypothetical protein ACIGHG_08730 [Bacillus sp. NPDC077411]